MINNSFHLLILNKKNKFALTKNKKKKKNKN